MTENLRPAAILWDFDGTLIDSEGMWQSVEEDLARELGGELPADYHEHTIGGTVRATAGYIVETVGSSADPDAVAAELWRRARAALATGPIRWRPGVESLLAEVAAAGVTQGVVSSGFRDYLSVTLNRLDPALFAVVVPGDEVEHNKPHPDPYLKAARLLGVRPEDCLVLEDSPTGARSGLAAGCVVLCVPTPDAPVPAAAPRLVVRPELDLDTADLFTLFAQARA